MTPEEMDILRLCSTEGAYHSHIMPQYQNVGTLDFDIENRRQINKREEVNYVFLHEDNTETQTDQRIQTNELDTVEYEETNNISQNSFRISNNNNQFQDDQYDTQFIPSDLSRESDEDVRVISNNGLLESSGISRRVAIRTRNQ